MKSIANLRHGQIFSRDTDTTNVKYVVLPFNTDKVKKYSKYKTWSNII